MFLTIQTKNNYRMIENNYSYIGKYVWKANTKTNKKLKTEKWSL